MNGNEQVGNSVLCLLIRAISLSLSRLNPEAKKSMFRKILLLVIVVAFVPPVFSQVTDKKDPKEEAAKLQKEAVAFLRDTLADVANMRTLENRISFTSEMAGLMWFHDEREARGMFNGVIGDFRELLLRYDAQMNSYGVSAEDEESGYRSILSGETSGRSQLTRKFRVAMAVRQQIASSLAEHDPDLALSFYYDSGSVITNAAFRTQFESRYSSFEYNLMGQIAGKNAAKAAQLGIKSLDKGLNYQHVDLLRKIYAKDADKGIEFGSALLSKAKSEKPKSSDLYVTGSLLDFGTESFESSQREAAKKPVYSQADLRELANILASAILESETGENGMQYVSRIEKYLPGRAMQIKAKFNAKSARNSNTFTVRGDRAVSAPPPDYSGPANTSGVGRAYSNSNMTGSGIGAEEQFAKELKNLGKIELPKEEREKVIAQARKILMQTPGKDKKIVGLSMLAAQVSRAGDKELAAEIMRDAEALVNPNPKNYQDFIFTWMLAGGYAESDPEKAFPILEDAIGRANSLITAFISVGEFIDVAEEMISDGEVQVGAFGGGMIRGLSKELGIAEVTINTLVKADFAKTKGLTNRFDRPEVRVLAKMLVLRAVLGNKGLEEAQKKTVEQRKAMIDDAINND